jgi:5-methylcytosine-specific restriction endonuclease McrA
MGDYKAAWRERTRTWAIDLLGGVCSRCGTASGLDFDHIESATKLFDISVGIRDGYGRVRLAAELAKCQLLCNPCHRAKSADSGDDRVVKHGEGKSGKRRCNCDPCRQRKREYMKDYMQKRRSTM